MVEQSPSTFYERSQHPHPTNGIRGYEEALVNRDAAIMSQAIIISRLGLATASQVLCTYEINMSIKLAHKKLPVQAFSHLHKLTTWVRSE